MLEQYPFSLFIHEILSRQTLQSISAVLKGTRRNISAVGGLWYSSNWTCTLRYIGKFFGINWIQKILKNPQEQKNNWSVAFSGNRKHPGQTMKGTFRSISSAGNEQRSAVRASRFIRPLGSSQAIRSITRHTPPWYEWISMSAGLFWHVAFLIVGEEAPNPCSRGKWAFAHRGKNCDYPLKIYLAVFQPLVLFSQVLFSFGFVFWS